MPNISTEDLYYTLKLHDADIFFRYHRALIEYNELSTLLKRYKNYARHGSEEEKNKVINEINKAIIEIDPWHSTIEEHENFLEKIIFDEYIENDILNNDIEFKLSRTESNYCYVLWNFLIDIMNESIIVAINFEKIDLKSRKQKIIINNNAELYDLVEHQLSIDNAETIYNSIKNGALELLDNYNNTIYHSMKNRASINGDTKHDKNLYEELLSFIFYYMDQPCILVNRFYSRFGGVAIFAFAWTCYFYCYCCAKTINFEQVKDRELDIMIINKCINSLKSEVYRTPLIKDKNRENESKKTLKIKSAANWTKLEAILRKHGEEIYNSGDTLSEVAKKIGTAWGETYTGKIPDPMTTIKRMLNDFAGINAKNVAQISDLIITLKT